MKRHRYFESVVKTLRLILITAPFLSSCAYHLASSKRQIPGGYDRIHVSIFDNVTSEPGIEVSFTNAMVKEVQRSKIAKVTPKNDSQITLEGTIRSLKFERSQMASKSAIQTLPDRTVLTTEYRILIETVVSARRNLDQKVLWTGSIRGEKSYSAPKVGSAGINSVDPIYNHSARHQTIALMANDMMSEAIDRMTENF